MSVLGILVIVSDCEGKTQDSRLTEHQPNYLTAISYKMNRNEQSGLRSLMKTFFCSSHIFVLSISKLLLTNLQITANKPCKWKATITLIVVCAVR